MIGLTLPSDRPLEVLCLGAHADDIEIGCGGTLLTLARSRALRVRWIVFSAHGERRAEAETGAAAFLEGAEQREIVVHDFPDGRFPMVRDDLKQVFEDLKRGGVPDVIFTHDEEDLHQDHELLGRLTRETFRDHLVLAYEIPKFDGGLPSPNVYVGLADDVVREKVRRILDSFPSQGAKHWLDEETLRGLMRLRGVETASGVRYAEGFHGRKIRLRP